MKNGSIKCRIVSHSEVFIGSNDNIDTKFSVLISDLFMRNKNGFQSNPIIRRLA